MERERQEICALNASATTDTWAYRKCQLSILDGRILTAMSSNIFNFHIKAISFHYTLVPFGEDKPLDST